MNRTRIFYTENFQLIPAIRILLSKCEVLWLVLCIETHYFYLFIHLSICAFTHLSNKYSILEGRTNNKRVWKNLLVFRKEIYFLVGPGLFLLPSQPPTSIKTPWPSPTLRISQNKKFMELIITYIIKIWINFFHMFELCLPKQLKSLSFVFEERAAFLFSAA